LISTDIGAHDAVRERTKAPSNPCSRELDLEESFLNISLKERRLLQVAAGMKLIQAGLIGRAIIPLMEWTEIIEVLDTVINSLEKARALLTGHVAPLKRGLPVTPGRRKVSAEGRARMAAAQKARWAKAKK
jgi:hypothetical protein